MKNRQILFLLFWCRCVIVSALAKRVMGVSYTPPPLQHTHTLTPIKKLRGIGKTSGYSKKYGQIENLAFSKFQRILGKMRLKYKRSSVKRGSTGLWSNVDKNFMPFDWSI